MDLNWWDNLGKLALLVSVVGREMTYLARSQQLGVQLGLALFILIFPSRPVFGYSCSGPDNCEAPQPNDVIFVGVVVRQGSEAKSIKEPAHPTVFRVLDSFHGLDLNVSEVEIWSPYYRNFVPGSRWVIDSVRSVVDGNDVIEDRHCGRSGRLDDPNPEFREFADEFLKRLLNRRTGTAPTTVRILPFANPLSGAKRVGQLDVVLRNADRTFQFSVPDRGEIFEGDVVPGLYQVQVIGGPLPFLGLPDGDFTALAGSCNDLWLEFGHKTRTSGIVTLPNGKPAMGARVSLMGESSGTREKQVMSTGETGEYEFRGMAPGEYSLSVQKPGYHETYYPAAVLPPAAGPIRVEDGADLTDIDIQISEEVPLANIVMQIIGLDGSPAASTPISVHVRESFEGEETINLGYGETDFQGRYTLSSKVGAHLDIHATVGPAAELYSDSTDPLETGRTSFTVLEAEQTESLRLDARLCKRTARSWEPCAAPEERH